jgi:hypothetical protein
MNIVTGEKIQSFCDHFIGSQNDFNYNPYIASLKDKHVNMNELTNYFNNKRKIFCYTYSLDNMDFLINKLSCLQNEFILVLHNCDHNFETHHLKLFDSLPKLKMIYTQNMNVLHDRVVPLPIGIANNMWPHGNLSLLNSIIQMNNSKDNLIYFNFNINTNQEKRRECYNKIIEKGISFIPSGDQYTYLYNLSKYKYAICPEGNGIDCHRLWECLYLKVIPICKKNILVEYFSKIFPIVLLDDWSDLNAEKLMNEYNNYSWENYDKLSFDYYRQILENIVA